LYQDLCSWDNLIQAYHKANRGKRGHPNVANFEYHLESNLLQLQNELLNKTYQPGPYHSFYIHEPKKRLISAAPFRDRVVHHALCNLIEPVFERMFIYDSYANRVGKGTHRALDRAQEYTRQYRYLLQCDVRQFFPSIDHQVLQLLLAEKIHDPQVLWLINQILASGRGVLSDEYQMVYFPGDDLLASLRPRGLPIGNLTSQFWANVYLNPLDHFVKRELGCKAYVRYVDDFLLFTDNKTTLWHWKSMVEQRLANFRITIHPGTHPRPVREGFPFLGFLVFPEKRRLKPCKRYTYQRKTTVFVRAYNRGEMTLSNLSASLQGWINHARYGNTVGLRKAMLGKISNTICPASTSSNAQQPTPIPQS
jgi:retron-type reverse transcriptase